MTTENRLPAPLEPGMLVPASPADLVPALIADAGEDAAWRATDFISFHAHSLAARARPWQGLHRRRRAPWLGIRASQTLLGNHLLMRTSKMKTLSALLGTALWLGGSLSSAAASQPTWETWVSGTGKDTGGCILTAPCASFQYAESQTNAGGTIYAISSGSYGMITITKSLSIIAADGVAASILVDIGKTGIFVNTSGVTVLLKGLHIVGQGISAENTYGVYVQSGSVTVDHNTIVNTQVGVLQYGGFVLVKSSVLQGNGTGVFGNNGVYVGASTLSGNTYGFRNDVSSYGDNDMNGNLSCDVCGANVTEVQHDQ